MTPDVLSLESSENGENVRSWGGGVGEGGCFQVMSNNNVCENLVLIHYKIACAENNLLVCIKIECIQFVD